MTFTSNKLRGEIRLTAGWISPPILRQATLEGCARLDLGPIHWPRVSGSALDFCHVGRLAEGSLQVKSIQVKSIQVERRMRLDEDQAQTRLVAHDHGVLCTMHPDRGVDAVPVVYAIDEEGFVGIPVDRVKPKASTRLQRQRNLETDPRATLLIEHWDADDWSRLWWVQVELRAVDDPTTARKDGLATRLAQRYPQYESQPFADILVLGIAGVTGWAAAS